MPQLDKVTFLSQFFWLCFFFLGFYLILYKYYLPKISRILAYRRKKMGFSQEEISPLQKEKIQVEGDYGILYIHALASTKNLFNKFFFRTTNWYDHNAIAINKKHYQNVHTSFIQSLGDASLSQNLLFYHAEKNTPQKYTFLILLHSIVDNNKKQNHERQVKKEKKLQK